MAFCPNKTSKDWKDLEAVQGSNIAHYLWDKYRGNVPGYFYNVGLKETLKDRRTVKDEAAWLAERGISSTIFESAKNIGSETVHGYVENAMVHLWSSAEEGTGYHEAYHLVFRTMLSEDQRAGLYAEAASTYGEPTQQDIDNVKKGFPNISDEEARLVALEEKMADEFKEYVLTEEATKKSLPQKIAKFFKDIWNFIKAIFSDGVSLRQMYSLIESNKMNSSLLGRGVFRNAERFKGPDVAYMYRPEMGAKMFDDTLNSLYTVFLEEKDKYGDKFIVSRAIGTEGRIGSVPAAMIKKMYESLDEGVTLTSQQAYTLFAAELAFDNATPENKNAAYNEVGKLLEEYNATFALSDNMPARNVFKNVASTWNDLENPVTGNVERVGWRTFLEIKLKDAAYTIVNSKGKYDLEVNDEPTEADQQDLEEEFAVIDEAVAKIYGKSSLQESPSKRLTGKVKELLARVKNPIPNSLGFTTYIPRDQVYKEVLRAAVGKQSFKEIKAELERIARVKPHLKNISDFVNGLKGPEAAMFYSAFALINTEFMMIRNRKVGEDIYADIINPNRRDVISSVISRWKSNLTTREDENPRALYREVPKLDSDGKPLLEDGEQVYILEPIKEKVVQAQQLAKKLERSVLTQRVKDNIPAKTTDNSISEVAADIAELMWTLGMSIGDDTSIAETQVAVQTILNSGAEVIGPRQNLEEVSGGKLANLLTSDLLNILRLVGDFAKKDNSNFGLLSELKPKPDYLSLNPTMARKVAELFGPLINPVGESYVGADGESRYPINIATNMADIVNVIKLGGEEAATLLDEYMKDPFVNGGKSEFQSILFKYLKESPEYRNTIVVKDFDASKGLSEFEDAMMYEDLSSSDILVVQLNAFINNNTNSKTTLIAIPVQSDRNKYTFIEVPRILANAYGIRNTESTLIKAQIVQDLLRVAQAKKAVKQAIETKDYSNLIEGYHTKLGDPKAILDPKTKQYLGNAFKNEFFQFTGKNEADAFIVTDAVLSERGGNLNNVEQLSDVIEKYIQDKLDPKTKAYVDSLINNMVNEMSIYVGKQADNIFEALKKDGKLGEIGKGGVNISTDPEANKNLYRGFFLTNMIMRNEVVKLFRGNRALHKNLTDFYKRMGHLTTPGIKMAMQGDVENPSWLTKGSYGMKAEYSEITLEDSQMDFIEGLKNQTNEQADNISNGLIKNILKSVTNVNVRVTRLGENAPGVQSSEAGVTINIESKNLSDALQAAFPATSSEILNAINIGNEYRPGRFKATDGQAFITLEMHRSIAMGMGQWNIEDEKAYEVYLTTGEFRYQEGFTPKGYEVGDEVSIKPYKPYFEDVNFDNNTGTLQVTSEKNSYSVLLRSYTKNFPQMNDLLDRMEGKGSYTGLGKIDVVNFVSGKKLNKKGIHKLTGIPGEYTGTNVKSNNSKKLRFPQIIPAMKDDPTVTFNRQIKKNMVSNVKDITMYTLNDGLEDAFEVDGKGLKALYHAAIEEKIRRDLEAVEKELSIDKLREAAVLKEENPENYNKVKLSILKNVRQILLKQIQDGDLTTNYSRALDIAFTPSGEPRFAIPLDLPIFNKKYESIIMSLFNNKVFKQKVKGFEAVQVAQLGGSEVDGSGALKFLQISEDGRRVIHAEVMIREDVARRFGIKPGQSLDSIPEELRRVVGYRIPNADKGATVILKIAKVLPANYEKAVVVPGQLTKLMGSDFDVDKLNLMFPEVEPDETSAYGVRKVKPDYNLLFSNPAAIVNPELVSDKALNNILIDTIEGVYSNPAHFKEVFTPLDDVTLTKEAERIAKAIPELADVTDWNGWNTESETIVKNIRGNKLRGIYANIIAGRNVAMHGTVRANSDFAIKIVDDQNNVTEYVNYLAEFDGITTDKVGALFLSAAVDAANTPVQKQLNDSVLTSRIRALFLAFYPEYDSATCTNYLNQPIIRELTSLFETKYGGNLRKFKKAYKALALKHGIKNLLPVKDPNYTIPMKLSEINNLNGDMKVRDKEQQAIMLHNFLQFYKAGKSLLSLYKRITPDSMDGMNRIGSIMGYNDKAAEYDSSIDDQERLAVDNTTYFFGPDTTVNVVDQFIGEDSIYGLERGYENLKNSIFENAGIFFPSRTSKAFLQAKEILKRSAATNQLTPEMHQLVDFNLMFMMLMKPGSPFFKNVNFNTVYGDSKNNIHTRLQALKTKHKALGGAKFLSGFELDYVQEIGYYGITLDTGVAQTRHEKEQFINGLRAMLFNPIVFISASPEQKKVGPDGKYSPEIQQEVDEIKKMGRNLIMHTFLTNGFRQSSSSYADMLPEEFFTIPMDVDGKKISISDFFYQERNKLEDASYFTDEDIASYLTMFGKMRAGGGGLLNTANHASLQAPDKENNNLPELAFGDHHEPYIVVKHPSTKSTAVYKKVRYEDGKSVYSGLKGSFSVKGANKLYGSGIKYILENGPKLSDNLPIEPVYDRTRANDLGETGTLSCSI